MSEITLSPGKLSLEILREIFAGHIPVSLSRSCLPEIQASEKTINNAVSSGKVVYGINTGFGLLANTRIPVDQLEQLQRSIVLSHAAGVGAFMDDAVVRLIMVLKINALSRGYSGIRLEVIQALIALVNAEVYPCIPEQGSVGASGDLAPLAHMSCVLLGEGQARYQGEIVSGQEALKIAGLEPVKLAPKEGLALLNGTQASTALALAGLFQAQDLFAAATIAGALSVEAALGSRRPFDPRIHRARGFAPQEQAAANYCHLLEDSSEIGLSHSKCEKVQDPYSLRCQPQVMGACLWQMEQTAQVLAMEANAVSDNPLVFAEDNDIISGGNFHAEPVAMVADNLALAIAEIGALSERRMALLIDSKLSGLPPFLVENGGVNSGFMIAQVTAAALASENKMLAHPASVDSLPTSANQEDHVSMATHAARRLGNMASNTGYILAVEILAAAQGIEFRRPHKTSPKLEQAVSRLRQHVPFYDKDRYFAPDIEAAAKLIKSGSWNDLMPPRTES
ncbi:histidine ammonia-lyase [Endozoicomonadaceae bacterium StTr2]